MASPTVVSEAALARAQAGPISYLAGGDGPPLLLLHGIPGSALAWGRVGAQLAAHYRVIIPDLLGFGASAPPRGDYYMEAQALALRQLLADLQVRELFLGAHDFGGPVALTLMRLCPELKVRALVLSSTNLFTDTFVPPPLRLAGVPGLGAAAFRAMAGTRLGLRLMYAAATRRKAEASWSQFSRHLTPSGIDLTWRIFQRSLADLRGNYQAVQDSLPGLTLPTLILWGSDDPFFAVSVARRSQRAIAGAALQVYAGTGHFVPEERPEQVAADIGRFLASAGG